MQYKYFLQEFKFDDFLRVSVLRKKRLFDDSETEIPLADQAANFRCTLEPSSDIDEQLRKLWADGAQIDSGLDAFIQTKLIPMLEIAWDENTITNYQKHLENSQSELI